MVWFLKQHNSNHSESNSWKLINYGCESSFCYWLLHFGFTGKWLSQGTAVLQAGDPRHEKGRLVLGVNVEVELVAHHAGPAKEGTVRHDALLGVVDPGFDDLDVVERLLRQPRLTALQALELLSELAHQTAGLLVKGDRRPETVWMVVLQPGTVKDLHVRQIFLNVALRVPSRKGLPLQQRLLNLVHGEGRDVLALAECTRHSKTF